MRADIRTFRGASMPAALGRVRSEMGEDAIILHSRMVRAGGFLGLGAHTVAEVVAAPGHATDAPGLGAAALLAQRRGRVSTARSRGKASPARAGEAGGNRRAPQRTPFLERAYRPEAGERGSAPGSPDSRRAALAPRPGALDPRAPSPEIRVLAGELSELKGLVRDLVRKAEHRDVPDVSPELLELYVQMVEAEVAENLARGLVKRLQVELFGRQLQDAALLREQLAGYIARLLPVAGPIQLREDRAKLVALIGPTGVGKTTTIAKIAVQFAIRERKRVALLTSDTYRIAATEQLRRYADLMNVPVRVVYSPEDAAGAIRELADYDLLLMDTAGRSQRDEMRMNELRAFLDATHPDETHLVVSANASSRTLMNVVERFGALPVDRLIVTKLDEAVSLGLVLNVAARVNRSLSYVTTGQGVPDDIEVAGAEHLARRILGEVAA